MNQARKIMFSLAITLAFLFSIFTAPAASPVKMFAVTGNAYSTNYDWAVASAWSWNGGVPVVQYVNVTADNATNTLYFYKATDIGIVTNTTGSATITNTFGSLTNVSCAVGDWVLHRFASSDQYDLYRVSAVATNSITATNNTGTLTGAAGDIMYRLSQAGSIKVGAATKEINCGAGGCWYGDATKPLVFRVSGNNACSINAISGTYQ